MRKNEISKAIDAVVSNSMTADRSSDQKFLDMNDQTWDDLNQLKDEVGTALLTMYTEINSILGNPLVRTALGPKETEMRRLENVFHADMDATSKKIQALRAQHEDKIGKIASLDEFNLFGRLTIDYQIVSMEIQTLLAPTMTSMMLLLHEVLPDAMAKNNDQAEDAVVKEVSHGA